MEIKERTISFRHEIPWGGSNYHKKKTAFSETTTIVFEEGDDIEAISKEQSQLQVERVKNRAKHFRDTVINPVSEGE